MHYVYYLHDPGNDKLLYIGRSINPEKRRRAFEVKYGIRAVIQRTEAHQSLEEACAAELAAISKHWPPYNKYLISSRGGHGQVGWAKGTHRSDEVKRKTSAALKGREFSAEHRAKISAALKGREFSAEWRAKLSQAHKGQSPANKGKPSPMKGIPVSPERRAALAEALRKRWEKAKAR